MNSNTQKMPIFFPPDLFIGSKQITSQVKIFNKKPLQTKSQPKPEPQSRSQIKHQPQKQTQIQTNKLSNKNYKLNIIKFRH